MDSIDPALDSIEPVLVSKEQDFLSPELLVLESDLVGGVYDLSAVLAGVLTGLVDLPDLLPLGLEALLTG